MLSLVNPTEWIADMTRAGEHPILYVAAPVAAQPGEVLATCTECGARNTFAGGEIDLRLICDHDAPVRHTQEREAIVRFNLERAMRWWRWLHLGIPEVTWTMPWYVNVTANGEGDPILIERGLRDDCAIARRCDGLMACGPRISSGMLREANAVHANGADLFQIEGFLREPPKRHAAASVPWKRWTP